MLQDVYKRIIESMRRNLDGLVDESPMQALGYAECIAALDELELTRHGLKRVEKQVRQSARARIENEKQHGRFGLVEKLLKSPVQSLAEAESTAQGRDQLMEIWSGLAKTLLEKAGWNEDEYQLACILLGSPNLKLRTSRARLELDRAIREDGDRKYEKWMELRRKSCSRSSRT